MTTRDAAVSAAARAFAAGLALRDSLPPRAAAEAAWTPSGPSVDELERMIRAQRGEAADGEQGESSRTAGVPERRRAA